MLKNQKRSRRIAFYVFFLLPINVLATVSDTMAPNFRLPMISSNETLALSDYKGKVLYLEFWASWCSPCKKSFPALNQIRDEFARSDFEIIGVHVGEQKEAGLAFLKDNPVDYPVVSDPNGVTPEEYKIKGMPYGFLINRKGEIVQVFDGFHHSNTQELKKEILRLIGR